jgi:hypothetical protein
VVLLLVFLLIIHNVDWKGGDDLQGEKDISSFSLSFIAIKEEKDFNIAYLC